MQTVEARYGAVLLLEPHGRLDSNSAKSFEDTVLKAMEPGAPRLVIDCSHLDYVSSAGLRVFLIAAKKAKAAQGSLALCGLRPHVREVFDISGFSRLFVLKPSRDEALAAVA